MDELNDFLQPTMRRLMDADTALHNGDAGPRMAIWSKNDPVTLFGALYMNSGWDDIRRTSTRRRPWTALHQRRIRCG